MNLRLNFSGARCHPRFPAALALGLAAAGLGLSARAESSEETAKAKAQREEKIFRVVQKALVDSGMRDSAAALRALTLIKGLEKPAPEAAVTSNSPIGTGTNLFVGSLSTSAGTNTPFFLLEGPTFLKAVDDPKKDGGGSAGQGSPQGKNDTKDPVLLGEFIGTDKKHVLSPWGFFHTGFTLSNPYHVVASTNSAGAPTYDLTSDGTTASAYFEFVYNNRWAFDSHPVTKTGRDGEPGWVWGDRIDSFDFQGRFGYTYASSSETSASTIAGSSEFNVEATVAWLAARRATERWRMSLGPEVSLGMTTDRGALDVHPRGFVGLGAAVGFDNLFTSGADEKIRQAMFTMRVGGAALDIPALEGDTRHFLQAHQFPEYDLKWNALAMEAELFYPLGKSVYLTAGGRVYANVHPAQWNLYLGVSMGLDRLNALFGGGAGDKENTKSATSK